MYTTNDNQINWRLERLAKRIKLIDIAKALKVTSSYICQFESGKDGFKLSHELFKAYTEYIANYQK